MDEAEHDVMVCMAFDESLRSQLHSTDEIEKTFQGFLLFFTSAVDLVAKRDVSAGSVIGQPVQSLPV
jgi:hypothetical protein